MRLVSWHTAADSSSAARSGLCMFQRGNSGRGSWLVFEFRRFLSLIRLLGRSFPTQFHVLNIRCIGVGVLSGFGERQRCGQAFRVDRVGESLKQLERAQSPAEQL